MRHVPGAQVRSWCGWTTRITGAEVAARNRPARFPAAPCVGALRIASAPDLARPLQLARGAGVSTVRQRGHRVVALVVGERMDEECAHESISIAPGTVRLGTSKMIAIQRCLLVTAWLRWGELRAPAWWWLRQWRVACPLSLLVMVEAANSMEHNVTGYLVDVEKPGSVRDAVMTLAIDEELRVKMGASGLQRCRKYFSAPQAAASIMDLYELYC